MFVFYTNFYFILVSRLLALFLVFVELVQPLEGFLAHFALKHSRFSTFVSEMSGQGAPVLVLFSAFFTYVFLVGWWGERLPVC